MMGKYSTKQTDEDGNVTWLANDGREFKSSGAAHRHSTKLEDAEKEAKTPPSEVIEGEKPPIENEEKPSFAEFRLYEEGELPSDEVPAILKRIRPAGDRGKRRTKKAIEAEREVNIAVLSTAYRGGDLLLTKYKRVMLEDPKADAIRRGEDDYEYISDVTNEALEHNGISLGRAIGPTSVAVIANTYWFGAPIYKIHQESERTIFKGRVGGAFKRVLRRVPIIGKRIRRAEIAEIKKVMKDDEAP